MTLTFWTSYDKVSYVMTKHVTTSLCDTVISPEKWPLSYQSLEPGTKHLPNISRYMSKNIILIPKLLAFNNHTQMSSHIKVTKQTTLFHRSGDNIPQTAG